MARRQHAAEVRLVSIAAAVVALLAVASVVLLLAPTDNIEDSSVFFKGVEPVDVMRVLMSNEYGTVDIYFTGEGYLVDDIPAELVDVEELIDLLTHCGKVYALRTVASASRNLGSYGLADPAARVEITYADGSALTLLVGKVESVTGNTYFSVDGDPAVYLMESERSAGFLLPKKAYVEDLVTPELALSSPLSALLDVTFIGGQLAEPVTVEAVAAKDPQVARTAISFGTATHIVRGKGVYELDQTYGVEMLGALLGISSYDILGYQFTQEEIMAFGFGRPTMQVEFDLKSGVDGEVEHYALALLQKDDAYYMTSNDNGVIYAVQEPAFLHVEYSKLLVRWFLSPMLMDVREIELTTGGKDYDFVITGETNAEKQVTCNGEELDIERFRALYGLLTGAAHDGRLLEDVVVEGAPLLRLTYHYLDAQKQPDEMELYPGDARQVNVRVNGVTELAMREMYLVRVQEAVSILWTDDPIETDW
ncbi:MAG: DUF4340 domain-containing protein [Anaerolineae bacterium]|nr:DUF4340 domain-containing protein [Anaerolineae bacterium]